MNKHKFGCWLVKWRKQLEKERETAKDGEPLGKPWFKNMTDLFEGNWLHSYKEETGESEG